MHVLRGRDMGGYLAIDVRTHGIEKTYRCDIGGRQTVRRYRGNGRWGHVSTAMRAQVLAAMRTAFEGGSALKLLPYR